MNMESIKTKYLGLGFKWKLMLAYILNTLVTFAIFDLTFHIIIETTITNLDLSEETYEFNSFSNTLTAESTASQIMSGLDIYDQYLNQLYKTMIYFEANPHIYTTLEEGGVNPPLTSDFQNASYSEVGIFFYTNSSTFYNQPYLDSVLANIASATHPPSLKRINIFYQKTSDPENLMARTYPATNDFTIPSWESVKEKISSTPSGNVSISSVYNDTFSLSSSTEVFALRTVIEKDDLNILMEVQIEQSYFVDSLQYIISYPNINAFVLKIQNQATQDYSLMGEKEESNITIPQYLGGYENQFLGNSNTTVTVEKTIDQEDYMITMMSAPSSEPLGQSFTTDTIQQNNQGKIRVFIILNKADTAEPSNIVSAFLENQKEALLILLYSWTVIMLLGAAALSLVVGTHQTSFFEFVFEKCQQYTQKPQMIHEIHLKVREQASKEEKNRLLLENLASIMQKIQQNKKQCSKLKKREHDEYPHNILYRQFQQRQKIRDFQRFEQIAQQLRQKLQEKESLKKQQI